MSYSSTIYDTTTDPDTDDLTLEEMRQGREPIWTFDPNGLSLMSPGDPNYFKVCKLVRCTKHLPEEARTEMEADPERDEPGCYPPQMIFMPNGGVWNDNITTVTMRRAPQSDKWVGERDNRPCGVCAFQQGIDKVRASIYKRKVFRTLEERWMTPQPNGHCGYAEWSWRKMKAELEGEVQF